jgi:hypothetical protein
MRKIIFILALSLMSCRCSPVKETQIDCSKRVSDLSASNWILRAQKDSLNKVIFLYQDSLWECQEGNRQLHQWIK